MPRNGQPTFYGCVRAYKIYKLRRQYCLTRGMFFFYPGAQIGPKFIKLKNKIKNNKNLTLLTKIGYISVNKNDRMHTFPQYPYLPDMFSKRTNYWIRSILYGKIGITDECPHSFRIFDNPDRKQTPHQEQIIGSGMRNIFPIGWGTSIVLLKLSSSIARDNTRRNDGKIAS